MPFVQKIGYLCDKQLKHKDDGNKAKRRNAECRFA